MAKTNDFRYQTTAPDAPSASIATIYADASGRLLSKLSGGESRSVGSWSTGTIPGSSVTTGSWGQLVPTYMIGVSGAGGITGLAHPSAWIPIVGPNQQRWVLPAYVYT
ncbi:MAG: hypothetical protein AABY22_10970 [Nanoarchaeota archaeon]